MKKTLSIVIGLSLFFTSYSQTYPVSLNGKIYRQFNHLRYWNGSAYVPVADSGSNYTISTGLTLNANTVTSNISTGVSGGQTIIGSTSTTSGLTLKTTTANATTGADFTFVGGNNGATTLYTLRANGFGLFGTTSSSATSTPLRLSMGGTYGNNAAGNSGNIKLATYEDGTTTQGFGTEGGGILGLYAGGVGSSVVFYVNAVSAGSFSATGLVLPGSIRLPVASTATSITASTSGHTVRVTATGQTITLPTAVGVTGVIYTIKLTASGSGTVGTTSSQTIDGSTTYSLSAQYKYVTVQSDGSNWMIIANN